MLLLNEETTWNAAERCKDDYQPTVKRITDNEITVSCENPLHPGGHICRFERKRNGDLYGECFLKSTGEACPAMIGHKVCYHLAAGASLFLALEDRDGKVETAVLTDAPLPRFGCRRAEPEPGSDMPLVAKPPKKGERCGAFQI